ncbi:translation initiation factor IF-2-like [Corvus kubaryi]|uniref:translation initiation factor IF-2-like n=1 Tax=Corvus kubaryi TaxID=68294 RepID=UPI001C059340|nr:translation initiation factor IF-2-like [Corvus kubaryi]
MIGTPRRKRSGGMSQVPRIVFMRERILAALQDIELELTALPGIIAEPVIVALGRETGQLVPVPEPGAAPDIQSTPPEPAAYASELATAVPTRTADPAPVAATTALAAEAPGSGAASPLAPELARAEVALPASAVEPAGGSAPAPREPASRGAGAEPTTSAEPASVTPTPPRKRRRTRATGSRAPPGFQPPRFNSLPPRPPRLRAPARPHLPVQRWHGRKRQ